MVVVCYSVQRLFFICGIDYRSNCSYIYSLYTPLRLYPAMWPYLPQKTLAVGGDYEQKQFFHEHLELHGDF